MRWIVVVIVFACCVPAFAQDASNQDPVFVGGTPGRDLRPDTVPDKPSQNIGWLDWVLDLSNFIWKTFLELVEWCVYKPAAWLRDLTMSWFCWLVSGVINWVAKLVPFEDWGEYVPVTYVHEGMDWLQDVAGFLSEVFPFRLWLNLATFWLGLEAGLAVVRWLIAIIPGT